ncbi:MAG: capsid protein [Pseudomonadota bacterium]
MTFDGQERDGSTEDYGLDAPIPNSDIAAARAARAQRRSTYDPEQNAVMMLTKLMELRREVRVAAAVQNAALYTGNRRIVLTGTDKLDDYVNSDPLEVLLAAINATLIYRANTLVMGHAIWQVISRHPDLVNAIRGNLTNKGIITRQELATLLEIKEVVVGEGYLNVARKGQPVDLQRVWGDTIQALYVDPTITSTMGEVTFGFTAEYGSRVSGRIEDPDIGIDGGFRIRVGGRQNETIAAEDVGAQIVGALTT